MPQTQLFSCKILADESKITKHKIIRYISKTDQYIFDYMNALQINEQDRQQIRKKLVSDKTFRS